MEINISTTPISYTGLYADDHIMDGLELGRSLAGFTRTANVITNFYFDGRVSFNSNTHKIKHFTGPPKENGVLFELVALSAIGTMPIYSPLLLDLAGEFIPWIWKATVAKVLGIKGQEEKMLEMIDAQAQRFEEFANKVHEGHMQDKAWMQEHISQIAERLHAPLKEAAAPIGSTARIARVGRTDDAVTIDEAAAQVLRSQDDLTVGDVGEFQVTVRAVNLDTGTGKIEFVGSDGGTLPVKITDPALGSPHNVYSQSLDLQKTIKITGKPVLKDGEVSKLFVSDGEVI